MPWRVAERKIGRAGGQKRRHARQREWDRTYGADNWAVGYVLGGNGEQGLILHGDGSQWTVLPSPTVRHGIRLNGVAAVTVGEKAGSGIPKSIVTDGPVVTKENAAGMLWMQDHFLI